MAATTRSMTGALRPAAKSAAKPAAKAPAKAPGRQAAKLAAKPAAKPAVSKGKSAAQKRKNAKAVAVGRKSKRLHVKEIKSGPGLRGMVNEGNVLCYRNSALQALMHIPPFGIWLHWHQAAEFGATIGWRKVGQQDAEEYLNWLLETMKSQLPRTEQDAFKQLFQQKMRSSIECRACSEVSSMTTPDLLLRVALSKTAKGSTLVNHLKDHMREEIDGFECSRCSATGQVTRTYAMTQAPDVLVLQLTRYTMAGKKNSSRVNFAETLDLSPYAADSAAQGSLLYRLCSVLDHVGGASLRRGHYVTVVRGPAAGADADADEDEDEDAWMLLDDERVRAARLKTAVWPEVDVARNVTPYILFYERL
ncbi:MAG: hypothetical protein M1832_003883 [Thelocarpon impressellum]|nr:MAG: hypothetical protein M1832_003883 [Thelocarpon impressellum]